MGERSVPAQALPPACGTIRWALACREQGGTGAQTVKYVYWQEEDDWLGYLEEYPDYWTRGEILADLAEHLQDLYADITSGQTPG